jgi:hypothetical protein
MRKSTTSSELLARQRYCITTGQVSCCSGGTGPTGPSGPAGTSAECGTVYSGKVSQNSAPLPVGAAGEYGFQLNGTVLYVSNGTSWVNVAYTTPIYFLDTVNNILYYSVQDSTGNATIVTDISLLFDCRTKALLSYNGSTWGSCCKLAPNATGVSNTSVSINSGSSIPLATASIIQDATGNTIQLTSSVYLSTATGTTGQGYLYLVAGGATGTAFPYTAGAPFPNTYSISETFSNMPAGASTVGLYGFNTGVTATGAANLSITYNLTP